MLNGGPGYIYILNNPSFEDGWVRIFVTNEDIKFGSGAYYNKIEPFVVFSTLKTKTLSDATFLYSYFKNKLSSTKIEKVESDSNCMYNIPPKPCIEVFYDIAFLYRIKMEVTVYEDSKMYISQFDRGIYNPLIIPDLKRIDNEFEDEQYIDSEYVGWTNEELKEAYDAAYEGHSRLELGLD